MVHNKIPGFIEFFHNFIDKHPSPCRVGHPIRPLLWLLNPPQISPNLLKHPRLNPSLVRCSTGNVCTLPRFVPNTSPIAYSTTSELHKNSNFFKACFFVISFLLDSNKLWFVNLIIKSICFGVISSGRRRVSISLPRPSYQEISYCRRYP